MDRSHLRYGSLMALATLAALLAAGCTPVLFTALYALKGNDIEAEFGGLKNKKVVVVCRSLAGLQYQDSRAAKELAQQINGMLKANVKKIKLVEQRKVDQWTDENTWDEFAEVGKALDAELVVGVELEQFRLYQGQTLYQGRASVMVHVFDCKKGGDPLYEKSVPQIIYPPNTCIQTSERPESQFRREFIHVIAEQTTRYFYGYDPYNDYARDNAAL
jgi:hypothetical protein